MRIATLICAVVLAGCSGGDNPETHRVDDVVRAFDDAGITLRSERLNWNADNPCASAEAFTSIAGVETSGWDCFYVGPEVGRAELPHAVLWNDGEKRHWLVWIYPTEEAATRVVETEPAISFRRQPTRYARRERRHLGTCDPRTSSDSKTLCPDYEIGSTTPAPSPSAS